MPAPGSKNAPKKPPVNKGGRPRGRRNSTPSVARTLRDHIVREGPEKLVKRVFQIAQDEDPLIALRAITLLWDRAFGKAAPETEPLPPPSEFPKELADALRNGD